ncbi:glycosyltransferase family 2 protein [Nocardioides maradonensis]
MRAGAVFVLYSPNEAYLANLATAAAGCPDLVAVDNTPEPDPALHARLRESGVRVVAQRNQGGLAGALNVGAELLFADGADVVFFLDQDSAVDEDFFTAMLDVCATIPGDSFLLGPRIYETTMDVYMSVAPPDGGAPVSVAEVTDGLLPASMVISSGSLITAAAWHTLGPLREDYFIEFLDAEYGMRAHALGVPVYVTPAVTLRQTWANTKRHGGVHTSHADPRRRYYMVRNGLDASARYDLPRRSYLRLAVREALAVLALERGKAGKLAAIAAGVADGYRGRLGRFEDRQPHLARRLGKHD